MTTNTGLSFFSENYHSSFFQSVHKFVLAFFFSFNRPHRYDIVKSHLDGFYTYFASNGFTHGSTWTHWDSLSRCRRPV